MTETPKTVAYCSVCFVLWDEKCQGLLTGNKYATYKHFNARVECSIGDAPERIQLRLGLIDRQ